MRLAFFVIVSPVHLSMLAGVCIESIRRGLRGCVLFAFVLAPESAATLVRRIMSSPSPWLGLLAAMPNIVFPWRKLLILISVVVASASVSTGGLTTRHSQCNCSSSRIGLFVSMGPAFRTVSCTAAWESSLGIYLRRVPSQGWTADSLSRHSGAHTLSGAKWDDGCTCHMADSVQALSLPTLNPWFLLYAHTVKVCVSNRIPDLSLHEGRRIGGGAIFSVAGESIYPVCLLDLFHPVGIVRCVPGTSFAAAYYRGSMGIMLVYDVSDSKTFRNVSNWMRQIEVNALPDVNRLLVGNKSDVHERERVSDFVLGLCFSFLGFLRFGSVSVWHVAFFFAGANCEIDELLLFYFGLTDLPMLIVCWFIFHVLSGIPALSSISTLSFSACDT